MKTQKKKLTYKKIIRELYINGKPKKTKKKKNAYEVKAAGILQQMIPKDST